MKKLIIGTFLMLGFNVNALANDLEDACTKMSATASSIMAARQEGVDKNDFLALVMKESPEDTPQNRMVFRYIKDIMDNAYAMPVVQSQDAKRQAVSAFQTEMHKLCMSNMENMFKRK